jgi:hypothetical protein
MKRINKQSKINKLYIYKYKYLIYVLLTASEYFGGGSTKIKKKIKK